MKVYKEIKQSDSEEKITLAYINAMWAAQYFGKKPPEKLENILKGMREEKKEMTAEDMLDQIKALNNSFGGTVY